MDNDTATAATIESLRAALDAARQALNETDMELARAMSRADVLAAEVLAWRSAYCDYQGSGFCDEGGTMNEPNEVSNTDRTHALDPAKFERKP